MNVTNYLKGVQVGGTVHILAAEPGIYAVQKRGTKWV